MKKMFIAIISMMMLMPALADAQIQKKNSTKTETLLSLRMGYMSLKYSEGTFYLAMRTTNQFDDLMILKLGRSQESAIQSLNDLIDIASNISGNECVTIDNGYGEEFRIYKGIMGGNVMIAADYYAGVVNTAKSEFKRCLDKILQIR